MRSPHRRIASAALLGLATILLTAVPARAADVFVQLSPSTVQAGNLVGIRASCRDNTQPATVESDAFGTLTAQPQDGFLTAAALVPAGTKAGSFRVRLTCPVGPGASATLMVVAAGNPSRGPATGFGGTAGQNPGGPLLTGGLVALVVGAVLALVALRQRSLPAPVRGRPAGARVPR